MQQGKVILVGSGCDGGLITLRGKEKIPFADVIVYDDLIDKSLLWLKKEDADLIYVGKREGRHSKKQEEINSILIDEAKKGKTVLRLKGGDSFVFGRGGEEIIALQRENIPFEVVPGVSSCIAVPESMGIPVTHRGMARSFTVVTAHSESGSGENYEALSRLKGTLVFLMGLSKASEISRRLIENGKDENTACSILFGKVGQTQRLDTSLRYLSQAAEKAQPPAVIVVGEVCKMHLKDIPKTVSVTVTGTEGFTRKLKPLLEGKGFRVYALPFLKIYPIKENLNINISPFKYIVFTSTNGVKVFFENVFIDRRFFANKKFACIGEGTANELRRYGFEADLIPCKFTAKELGKALSQAVKKNERVLILRAENGSRELNAELSEKGIDFLDLHIYKTVADTSFAQNEIPETDYTVFASQSGVRAFFDLGGDFGGKAVCIGEITAKELKKHREDIIICKKHTAECIVQTIEKETYKS